MLQHENARPQTANKTLNTNRDLKLELLQFPPCSMHLVPNDFHMFAPLKMRLGTSIFQKGGSEKCGAFVVAHTTIFFSGNTNFFER